VDSVPVKGRDTMGVRFAGVGESDAVVAIARNTDLTVGEEELEAADGAEAGVQDVDGSPTETAPESVQNDDQHSTDTEGAATVEGDEAGQEGT
jgi:DNA gyrase subunit A